MKSWDARRDLMIADTTEDAIAFAAEHWIHTAQRAIQQRGYFSVALSGGSTPKAIYQLIASKYPDALDWDRVYLFWSDERAVPPNHPDSNYKMAMDNGFQDLPISPAFTYRMRAEGNIEQAAKDYQELISRELGPRLFDLIMLGVGEDGHTASLFPGTSVLDEETKLVASVLLPETKTKRMTLTFPCIEKSSLAVIYALGKPKEAIVPIALNAAIRSPFPVSRIGTPEHKALWILDKESARLLNQNSN
jgi:6-phosphogluconolactonase